MAAAAACLAGCESTDTAPLPSATQLTRLGRVEQDAHHLQAAAGSYRAALASDWNYVPALVGLAGLEATTDPVEAAALLDQAIALAPSDATAHRLLGRVLMSMGERSAGRNQLRLARRSSS